MQLFYTLKKTIINKVLLKRKESQVFNIENAEHFQIPEDAGDDFNNSYYFSAHNLDGQSLFLRLGLRGDRKSEIWFAYRDKDIFYSYPIEIIDNQHSPLQVECMEAGKKWKIIFQGKLQSMVDKEDSKEASFEGFFTATSPIFDFFLHANPEPMARAFAKEKWNKTFFKEVQKNNQTHYEQPGKISGRLLIGNAEIQIDMNAIRDHSFGKRDWNYMDKHVWLMAITEKGDALNISKVSYPALSNIEVGNFNKNGKTTCLLRFKTKDDLINNGLGANSFSIDVLMENGEKLKITGKRDAEVVYTFSDGKYTLREGMGEFSINGEKARGIIEFGFNKDNSRWYRDK